MELKAYTDLEQSQKLAEILPKESADMFYDAGNENRIMVTEDFCSKEIYKALLKKGFDGEIHTTYDKEGYTQASVTLQMACKWLREIKQYYIDVHNWDGDGYTYEFIDLRNINHLPSNNCFEPLPTYEQAIEAALKYSLEKLI